MEGETVRTFVLDASVAVKWFLDEEASDLARVMLVDQGNALVEVEGRRRRVPIMIVKGEIEPVIGLTTLEALGLRVNPITHKLEPVRPKLLRMGRGGGLHTSYRAVSRSATPTLHFLESRMKWNC